MHFIIIQQLLIKDRSVAVYIACPPNVQGVCMAYEHWCLGVSSHQVCFTINQDPAIAAYVYGRNVFCSIREDDFFVMLKLHKQQVMGWIGDLLNARILGQCVLPAIRFLCVVNMYTYI